MENPKVRDSNFELLRIILMLMVVGLHVAGNTVLSKESPISYGKINFYFGHFVESFFVIAVNCFVLISGYFGIKSSFKKLLKFYIPIWFYSVAIFFFISYVYENNIPFSNISFFTPFISEKYWFATSYILLFIFSPLLNIILENLTKHQLIFTIIVALFLFVLIPSFTPYSLTGWDRGMSVVNFIILYFIGHYIRHYYIDNKKGTKYIIVYILISLMILFLNVFFAKYFSYNKGWMNRFYAYDSILVYISAISLFLYIKTLSLKSPLINKISPLVFYVYVIHEHPKVREVLYTRILDYPQYADSNYWIIYVVLGIISIFLACLLIEFLRKNIFEKSEEKLINQIDKFYNRLIKKALSK